MKENFENIKLYIKKIINKLKDIKFKKFKLNMSFLLIITNMVTIIAVVMQIVSTNYQLRLLNNQLSYMQDTNYTMQAQIENMQKSIKKTLEGEASLIAKYSIEPVSMDFQKGVYTLQVKVTPKEYTEYTDAIIFFGTQEYKLEYTKNCYEKNITLPLNEYYDGQVTFLFQSGTKKNTEVLNEYSCFLNIFKNALSGKIKKSPKVSNGFLEFEGDCSYALDGQKKYTFSTFELLVDVDNVNKFTIDMLKTHEEEKKKGENTDKKASSSKLSDVFAHKQEEGNKVDNDVDKLNSLDTDTQETQKTEISNISGKIDLAKYIKDSLPIENGNKVRIYYKAITSEGYVFTYDLFNGIVDVNSEDGWKAGIAPYKIYYEVRDLNDYPLRLK
ncbi:hypothetical protein [Lachnobacterium bovis]|uniref:Uncharacterized protein n=1 Tax=Lachnobacterium bovis TaxID=140626 RepID=A0A1H9TKD1_9FIRM|nr:hypothetical protein [Lachnobacterium bovis]SER97454.1 hypothetical protein SAMN02910429_01675 [Lachnobacterium bovis]